MNRVKHERGQLRLIAFSNGLMHVPGYYLEAVDLTELRVLTPCCTQG